MRIQWGVLRTRVARRILLFFLLCAVLPVSVLSLLSYTSVRNQLISDAQEGLGEASKVAGNALAERFQFLESRARLAIAHSGVLESESTIEGAQVDEEFEGFEAALLVPEGGGGASPLWCHARARGHHRGRAGTPGTGSGPTTDRARAGR